MCIVYVANTIGEIIIEDVAELVLRHSEVSTVGSPIFARYVQCFTKVDLIAHKRTIAVTATLKNRKTAIYANANEIALLE